MRRLSGFASTLTTISCVVAPTARWSSPAILGVGELIRRLKGLSQPRMPVTGPPFLSDAAIARFEQCDFKVALR
jgi:hypothetical protein